MQTISMDVHIKFCMWFELAVKTQLYWQFILCFFLQRLVRTFCY